MSEPIWVCTCPVVLLAANRRDRRAAQRRGILRGTNVTRHVRGCPMSGSATRSDPERGHR